MAQPLKNNIVKDQIGKDGYFNYFQLYNLIMNWFNDRGYDVFEKKYAEKLKDEGKKIDTKWQCYRPITDYFKFEFVIKFDITGMSDVTIERDGKKEKTNKGDLKFNIEANLMKDYEARWENKPFWKFLRGVYDNYVLRTTNDEYADKLLNEATELINEVKAFLEI